MTINWYQQKADYHRKQMEQAKADNKPKAEAAHKLDMNNYLRMINNIPP